VKRVLITGVSGYFGSKLVSFLAGKEDVEEIIGIDIKEPSITMEKLTFIRHDVREDLLPLVQGKGIDWGIHAAYILPPLHNKCLMEDININGTLNFLRACAEAGIPQLVQCSSTTAYGFHPDNEVPLKEDSPLRGNIDFTYSKNKRELENLCREFREDHPGINLIVVRPCFVVGPGIDNPLSRHLTKKIVLIPAKTAPFQYIHEDDLVEIIYLLLKNRKTGDYNLVADGLMTFDEMIRALGNWPLKLPFSLMYPLNNLAWFLRLKFLTEFPSCGLNMVVYPWYASNDKVKNDLGYRFGYTTREAFADFVRHVADKKKPLLANLFPNRRGKHPEGTSS